MIDEELDNDLVTEEQDEEEGQEGTSGNMETTELANGTSGRESMSEDEIIAAIQSAMNKASAHMEDSTFQQSIF